MDLHSRKIGNSSLLSPNLKALLVNELWAFKVWSTSGWNYANGELEEIFQQPLLMSEYALPAYFGTRIAKGVIYLKNKERLNLKQFRKTRFKKTSKIAALYTALFLS